MPGRQPVSAPVGGLPERQLAVIDGVLALAAFLLPQMAAALLFRARGAAEPPTMMENVAVIAVCFAAVLCWGMLRRRALRWAAWGLGASLAGYGLFLLAWVPMFMWGYPELLRLCGVPLPPQQTLEFLATAQAGQDLYLALLVACLLGPLAEEVLFRGFVYRAVAALADERAALLLSSALFGFFHGALYALPLALVGLCFGWARMKTGALLAPILLHVLHNSLTVAVNRSWPELLTLVYDK